MKFPVSCALLAVISTVAAQQYPVQINPNLGSLQYHPRQIQPQPLYNLNKQIQYREYHQLPLQRQPYQPPIVTSAVDSSYTYYNGRNSNAKKPSQQKQIPITSPQQTVTLKPKYTPTSTEVVTVLEDTKVLEEDNDDEENIDLNAINDSATRATMLWRAMAAKHPGVAAKAAMYWRVKAVRDARGAAEEAMAARKMIATGPEEMARVALAGVDEQHRIGKRTSSSDAGRAQSRLPPYWREYAAHDPEVTARSAMYWVNDEKADMYW